MKKLVFRNDVIPGLDSMPGCFRTEYGDGVPVLPNIELWYSRIRVLDDRDRAVNSNSRQRE